MISHAIRRKGRYLGLTQGVYSIPGRSKFREKIANSVMNPNDLIDIQEMKSHWYTSESIRIDIINHG